MRKFYLGLLLCIFMETFQFAAISTPFCSDIQAVIFDCDGVLVDTEYLKFQAWREALAEVKIDLSLDEYMPLIGSSSKKIMSQLASKKKITIPPEVIEVKNLKYKALQNQGVIPIKEMIAFAKDLTARKEQLGIKLGLASAAPKKEIIINLKQIGLEDHFDVIISGADDLDDYVDLSEKNKPKPYIYMETAKRLNVPVSKCLVFEDTEAGIEAAATSGMFVIAVPNKYTKAQDFSKATKVVHNHSELAAAISEQSKIYEQ